MLVRGGVEEGAGGGRGEEGGALGGGEVEEEEHVGRGGAGGEGALRGAISARAGGSVTEIEGTFKWAEIGDGETRGTECDGGTWDAVDVIDVGRARSELANSGGDGEACSGS